VLPRSFRKRLIAKLKRERRETVFRIYLDDTGSQFCKGRLSIGRSLTRSQPVHVERQTEQAVVTTFVALGHGHGIRNRIRM
jgi:EAL domain-containing protein (putative c-di-GMP-specific phosphodiesterase class I)